MKKRYSPLLHPLKPSPSLDDALQAFHQGRVQDAATLCRQLLKLQPGNAAAWHLLGLTSRHINDLSVAAKYTRKAIELSPDVAEFHNSLGATLLAQGKTVEAISSCERAAFLDPTYSDAAFNLGLAHQHAGNPVLSIQNYRRALELKPDYPEAHNNLASLLHLRQKLIPEAIEHYRRAVQLRPGYAIALNNWGNALKDMGRLDEAIAKYLQAIKADPQYSDGFINLGTTLQQQGLFFEAAAAFAKAVALKPDDAAPYCHLGNVAQAQNDPQKAISWYLKALKIRPHYPMALYAFSLALLHSGNLDQGWLAYQWRWQTDFPPVKRNFPNPWWQGESLAGKTVLVWGEQGVGDEILFANVLPDVIKTSGHCIVECDPRLVPLLARSFPAAEILPRSTPPQPRLLQTDIDFQAPMGDLPRWLRPTIESFPKHHGYLKADPQRVDIWKHRLDALGPGIKVGIAWRSSLRKTGRDLCYTSLSEWSPILTTPGVIFVNLQYDECREELAEASKQFGVNIHTWDDIDLMNELDEAAALTQALELVISAGTAVAAMAGALGKPTWLLNMANEWCMLGTGTMPWFPDTRVILKSNKEGWQPAIDNIAHALAEYTPSPAATTSAVTEKLQQAVQFHQAGQLDQAHDLYQEILKTQPDNHNALNLLGMLAQQANMHDEAIGFFQRAIKSLPSFNEAHNNLGNSLCALGRKAEGIDEFKKALSIDPNHADALTNLGIALLDLGRHEEACAQYKTLLASQPENANAHNNLALALEGLGKYPEAISHFEKAIAIRPDYTEAYNNLGNSLKKTGRPDTAAARYEMALKLKPDYAEAIYNLGLLAQEQGYFESAITHYYKTLSISPKYAEAHWNLGLSLLNCGKLEQGWREHEWRWGCKELPGVFRDFPTPWWQGEDLTGKTLLVWGEQGVGDEILFASILPDAIKASGHCIVECDPRLVPLLARSFPTAEVLPRSTPFQPRLLQTDIDFQAPSGNLPRWFRPSIESFPQHQGYLKADPQRVEFWKQRLDALGPGLKVGICWRSRLRSATRDDYYTGLSNWGSILATAGVVFINLQYDECREELRETEQRSGVKIHAFDDIDLFNNLDEAAALTAALDLIIAPNTSVFSMAGALGKPVWLLNPATDWAAFGTGTMPWFPDTRLFLKSSQDGWQSALSAIASELATLSTNRAAMLPATTNSPNNRKRGTMTAEILQQAFQLHQAGQLDQAHDLYQEILKIQPETPDALHLLGLIALDRSQHTEAVELISKAIALQPNVAGYFSNLGTALLKLDRQAEAISNFRKALELDPNYADAHYGIANTLYETKDLPGAKKHYQKVVALRPDAEAHNHLGVIFKETGQLKTATSHFKTAIKINPNYAEAHYNLGNALESAGEFRQAIACFRRALQIKGDYEDARWNIALKSLLLGDLAEGWNHFEHRWRRKDFTSAKRDFPAPPWRGEPLTDKTLLVWGEQGVGDEIMFANVLPDVIQTTGHCIVECDPRLVPLYTRSFPHAEVVARLNPAHSRLLEPDITFQTPIGNLPKWFRPTIESFPRNHGYLKADPERVEFWKHRLDTLGQAPKIGIAWRSMIRSTKRDASYTELSDWKAILTVPGVILVNLQYDECRAELEAAQAQFGVKIHSWEYIDLKNDLDDAAALTTALDLVISPDISVAGMAGAVGKETWMYCLNNNWVKLGVNHIPWMPSITLHEKTLQENWGPVLKRIGQKLRQYAKR